ncbi:MAG: PCRF domain-containing protein, partial [Actinobacteria bacterium]|nr:PCRF domain-containing protein [Actinomycetota bacterium]
MLDIDFNARIRAIRSTFADIATVMDLPGLESRIAELEEQAAAPGLWDDPDAAQKVTSSLSHSKSRFTKLSAVRQRLDDLDVLLELAQEMDDEDSAEEARVELAELESVIGELEVQTMLSGEYDARPAVITIRSGAGGDDATDFAEMLMRMYLRWAEQHDYPTKVLDTSYAEGAGIKSATFEVDAPYAFGT